MPEDPTLDITLADSVESKLSDVCFAYVPSDAKGEKGNKSHRKLRLCDDSGNISPQYVSAAASAFSAGGYRGNPVDLPAGEKTGAINKVRRAWKKAYPDKQPSEMPSSIRLTEADDVFEAFTDAMTDEEIDQEFATTASMPDECFGYVTSGKRHLRKLQLCGADGTLDAGMIKSAAADVTSSGFKGNPIKLKKGTIDTIKSRVRAAWTKTIKDEDPPSSVALSADEEKSYWFADAEGANGTMIALWVPLDVATDLALDGGLPAVDLHLTLAILPGVDPTDSLAVSRIVAAVDEDVRWRGPITGKISGWGRFDGGDDPDSQDVFYASVDAPGLSSLRDCIVDSIRMAGYDPAMNHDFTPHITLSYIPVDSKNPIDDLEPKDVSFPSVVVAAGATKIEVPFYKSPATDMNYYAEPPDGIEEWTALSVSDAKDIRVIFSDVTREWIPYLPVPGVYKHKIFGKLDFTSERYGRIITNFKNDVFGQDLPISAEHVHKEDGALGWIEDMRLAEDGSVEVRPKWNAYGRTMIDDDRFRYVSAELLPKFTHPTDGTIYHDVAVGHTVCIRPHFKVDTLQPLCASEEDAIFRFADEARKEFQVPELEEKIVVDPTIVQKSKVLRLSDDPDEQFEQILFSMQEREKYRQEFVEKDRMADEAKKRAATAEENERKIRKESMRQKFTAEVLGRSEHNALRWLGDTEAHVDMLVSLAEQFGEESLQVNYVIGEQRAKRRALERSGVFKEVGLHVVKAGGQAFTEVEALATQLRESKPALSREAAVTQVFRENPDFYDKYLLEEE